MEDNLQKVFVYGTLKPGGDYWDPFCEGKVSTAIAAKIKGELYDLHVGYPGAFMRGDDWIYGYLLTFIQKADFDQLDILEGYEAGRPEGANEYLRRRVDCFSMDDRYLGEVWAYEMTELTFQRFSGTLIKDGYWLVD